MPKSGADRGSALSWRYALVTSAVHMCALTPSSTRCRPRSAKAEVDAGPQGGRRGLGSSHHRATLGPWGEGGYEEWDEGGPVCELKLDVLDDEVCMGLVAPMVGVFGGGGTGAEWSP